MTLLLSASYGRDLLRPCLAHQFESQDHDFRIFLTVHDIAQHRLLSLLLPVSVHLQNYLELTTLTNTHGLNYGIHQFLQFSRHALFLFVIQISSLDIIHPHLPQCMSLFLFVS